MPDLARAWAFLEGSDLVCGEREVQGAIARLADQISGRLRDAYPLVLVVMGGAVVFAGQLLPRLRFPLDLDYVHATRYGAATQGGGLTWRVSPPPETRGRTVLLLDDILDHGKTLRAMRDQLPAHGAAEVLGAVLGEKILPAYAVLDGEDFTSEAETADSGVDHEALVEKIKSEFDAEEVG